jgi:phosphoglycolate phosphatase
MSLPESFARLTNNDDRKLGLRFTALFGEKANGDYGRKHRIVPGHYNGLKTLQSQNIKVGIVSSKQHHILSKIVDTFAIGHLVDSIVGSEDVQFPKPHPEGILITAKRFKVKPARILYIGDSVIDAAAAQGAGVDFVAVMTGPTSKEKFLHFPSISIVGALSEIFDNPELCI